MRPIVSLMLIVLAWLAPGAAAESAHDAVRESTDKLLARLVEAQPLFESAPEQFVQEVGVALDPHIDFEGFSRGVMAKHWRAASEQQRSRFQAAFRESLLHTYARALGQFDNQKVVVLPASGGKAPKPNRATVSLEVHGKSGQIYPVFYQMTRRSAEAPWKLRNIVINGVNLGLQFRSQFAALMERHGGDIDLAIDSWSVEE